MIIVTGGVRVVVVDAFVQFRTKVVGVGPLPSMVSKFLETGCCNCRSGMQILQPDGLVSAESAALEWNAVFRWFAGLVWFASCGPQRVVTVARGGAGLAFVGCEGCAAPGAIAPSRVRTR